MNKPFPETDWQVVSFDPPATGVSLYSIDDCRFIGEIQGILLDEQDGRPHYFRLDNESRDREGIYGYHLRHIARMAKPEGCFLVSPYRQFRF